MPDAVSIIATIAAIKNSIDIAKAVKDADYDLDKAILKEKIAVLVDSLLEAKIQAGETLDTIQEKDKRICELEELLKFKSKLVRKDGIYFVSDEDGNPTNDPYCPRCWEIDQKATHLRQIEDNYFKCANCKSSFGKSRQFNSSDGYY